MTQPISYATARPVPGNSRGGLITMGVISIVLGGLAGCGAAVAPLALVAQRYAPRQPGLVRQPVGSIVALVLLYAAIATALVWTGVGSCRCRRWCRPVVLVIAWPALVTGVLSTLAVAAMLAQMADAMAAGAAAGGGPPLPKGFFVGMMIGSALISLVFYVALPAVYVWYYRRPQTQLTLDALDPRPNWTDGRPLPVLGTAIWMAIAAVGVLTGLAYRVAPLFGRFVTGPAAAVVILAVAAVLAWGAREAYRARPAGWWVAIAFVALGSLSWVLTLATVGLGQFYVLAGMPAEQIQHVEQMQGGAVWAVWVSILWPVLFAASTTAFLIYARRFFNGTTSEPPILAP